MIVPLLDLTGQYASIKDEILSAVLPLFESQRFVLGPVVEEFEKNLAAYCKTRFAVGVSSGTDALLLSLMAAGVGHGDMVVTTPYTFFATAGSIVRTGAKPLFVDIDSQTYNMDPKELERLFSELSEEHLKRVKAIIPVHLYGQCAEMKEISSVAAAHDLFIIEDAAQAIGALYEKRRAGSLGDCGCFSFFPSKNLGAFGDAGMITTDSRELARLLRILRVHGAEPKYHHHVIGGNFRMDAIQAAVLNVKLRHLDTWTEKRRNNAHLFKSLLSGLEEKGLLRLPVVATGGHIYNQFVISVKSGRDQLVNHLKSCGIGTEIYYPVPLHLQKCFEYLGYRRGDFPRAEYAADHTLALPVYPELTESQIEYVAEKIRAFYL